MITSELKFVVFTINSTEICFGKGDKIKNTDGTISENTIEKILLYEDKTVELIISNGRIINYCNYPMYFEKV
jgi:hypothetical protein